MDDDDAAFTRNWSARAYDEAQLAQIREIEAHIVKYARRGWRSMKIPPPRDRLLICACTEGLVLMRHTQLGDWRTSLGQPHAPPTAWMPAPLLPGEEEEEED